MLITGATSADFISYDSRMMSKSHQTKIISVKQDKKFQDNLHFRLVRAVEEKYKILSDYLELNIKNKNQFNELALR